jgi:DNA-binding transcriptional LysR family regulator
MELHEVRYALALYRTLNFTRAAEQCHITTSALSRGVKKLEEELGAQLFRRDTTSVSITEFGQTVRPHLEQVVAQMTAARSTARAFLKLENALVSVGVMCTIGPSRFLSFLTSLRVAHEGIELSLVEGTAEHLGEMLLDKALDFAVMARPHLDETRLEVHELYAERFCVAVPLGHRFESLNEVSLAVTAQEQHLLRVNCEHRGYILDCVREQGIELPVVFRSEREDWILTMVAGGFGVSFVPEFSPADARVKLVPIVQPQIERTVALVSLAGAQLTPAAARVGAVIRAMDWR